MPRGAAFFGYKIRIISGRKDAMILRQSAVPNQCRKIYGTTPDRKYGTS